MSRRAATLVASPRGDDRRGCPLRAWAAKE